jgi:peptide deformylase
LYICKKIHLAKQLPITTLGMEILRKKTIPVTKIDSKLIHLVENMFYTMDHASGVGIAAPQVNSNLAVTVVDISTIEEHKKEKPLVLINPEIIESHGNIELEEGCLSIPDIRGMVSRPEKIFLKYYDFDLEEIKMEVNGFLSRVIQHEIDHLNGKLFIDYFSDEKKKEIKKELSKIRKGKIATDYPLLIHTDN